jgi:hypothetical protein
MGEAVNQEAVPQPTEAQAEQERDRREDKAEGQLYARHLSTWLSMRHHRTHKGERFDPVRFPYIRKFIDDPAQVIVGKKSTQGGWTEGLIIKAMAALIRSLHVFWVMPTHMLKGRFVKNRWDLTVAHTPYYQQMKAGEETQVSRFNPAASMSLQQFGNAAVAFIGSNSMSGFGEFPADVGVVDEFDNCDQGNLPMLEERLSNSEHRIRWLIGNPTISGRGISLLYKDSDQRKWYVECEACGHEFAPSWLQNVVREVSEGAYEVRDPKWDGPGGPDARLICDACGRAVERFKDGRWIAENPGAAVHGYHVNKLFSTRMTINEMLDRFTAGLVNPEMAQRFWNGDMGEAYEAPGSHVTLEDIQGALGDWANGKGSGGPCFVGVDVGAVLHVVVGELTPDGKQVRVVWVTTMPGTSPKEVVQQLREKKFVVRGGIIDEKPETRFSRRLAYSSRKWLMARYVSGKRDTVDLNARVASVDRTGALDAVVEGVRTGSLTFPADVVGVSDFAEHLQALTRVYNPDANKGEGAYEWQGDRADHFFHALGYMMLARRLVVGR